jgi:hypothetical protein
LADEGVAVAAAGVPKVAKATNISFRSAGVVEAPPVELPLPVVETIEQRLA